MSRDHLRFTSGACRRQRRGHPFAAALLGAVLAVSATSGAEAACLSQSEARTAVSSGEARPLGSIAGAVSGEIVRADLCREGGRLVYVLSVLTGGRVANMVVDARSGRLLR